LLVGKYSLLYGNNSFVGKNIGFVDIVGNIQVQFSI